MPPKGWTSITVPVKVYEYFKDKYEEKKAEFRLKYGISSFSGFVTKLLNDMIQEYETKESPGRSRRSRSGTPPS